MKRFGTILSFIINLPMIHHFFKQWDMYLCPVCTEITIQRITSFSEETELNGKPIKYIDLIFPSGSSENKHLPPPVRDAFEAALKVRNLDGAVCKDLQSENILPPIMEGISYILRKEGNSAAHADDTEFSSETFKLMIEFTEVILDYVYSLPEKISKLN